MAKSTISITIFNSYVKLPEGWAEQHGQCKKTFKNTSRLSVEGRRIRLQLWGPEEVVLHGEGEHHLLRVWTQQNDYFEEQ